MQPVLSASSELARRTLLHALYHTPLPQQCNITAAAARTSASDVSVKALSSHDKTHRRVNISRMKGRSTCSVHTDSLLIIYKYRVCTQCTLMCLSSLARGRLHLRTCHHTAALASRVEHSSLQYYHFEVQLPRTEYHSYTSSTAVVKRYALQGEHRRLEETKKPSYMQQGGRTGALV